MSARALRPRGTRLFVAAVAAALLLVACGGGGDGDGGGGYVEPKGPADTTVKVLAGNFFFDPDEIDAAPGVTKIEMEGAGGIHTFVFDDAYPGFQLEVSGDDTDAKKIELEPGSYDFYCDIPGHRQQGMEGTLTVS